MAHMSATATVAVGPGPTLVEVAAALARTLGVQPEGTAPDLEFDAGDVLWLLADFTEEHAPGAAFSMDPLGPLAAQDAEARRVFDELVAGTDWWVQLWADDNRVLIAERR